MCEGVVMLEQDEVAEIDVAWYAQSSWRVGVGLKENEAVVQCEVLDSGAHSLAELDWRHATIIITGKKSDDWPEGSVRCVEASTPFWIEGRWLMYIWNASFTDARACRSLS